MPATVLLPLAMPPVRPSLSMGREKIRNEGILQGLKPSHSQALVVRTETPTPYKAELFLKLSGRALPKDAGAHAEEACPARDLARRRRAALTVLLISMVMVMGPTPPGTGVRKPAVWMASG